MQCISSRFLSRLYELIYVHYYLDLSKSKNSGGDIITFKLKPPRSIINHPHCMGDLTTRPMILVSAYQTTT